MIQLIHIKSVDLWIIILQTYVPHVEKVSGSSGFVRLPYQNLGEIISFSSHSSGLFTFYFFLLVQVMKKRESDKSKKQKCGLCAEFSDAGNHC